MTSLTSHLLMSIFFASVIQNESVTTLNKLLCTFDENITIFVSPNVPDLGDFILLLLVFRSLQTLSRYLYETTNQEVYIKFQDLFIFINNRIQVLELAGESASLSTHHSSPSNGCAESNYDIMITDATKVILTDKFLCCGKSHSLKTCYKELPVNTRFKIT